MKKLIVLTLTFASFVAAAQTGTERMQLTSETLGKDNSIVHLVPVAGMTVSNLERTALSASTGYSAGAYGELGRGYVQWQSGITHTTYEQQFDFALFKVQVREQYLSFPNSLKVNFMGDPTRTVYLKAGLTPAWLTSQSYETDGWWKEKTSTDIFRKFQLFAQGAVGGAIRAGRGAVIVEGSYIRGTTSAFKLSKLEGESKGYGTLAGVMISTGYSFSF